MAALDGQPDIAIGNVVGSNIFNLVGVLGITALITAIPVTGSAVRLEWPIMFLSSAVLLLLARDGSIDRLEGIFLLAGLIVFTAYMVWVGQREVAGAEEAAAGRSQSVRAAWDSARRFAPNRCRPQRRPLR